MRSWLKHIIPEEFATESSYFDVTLSGRSIASMPAEQLELFFPKHGGLIAAEMQKLKLSLQRKFHSNIITKIEEEQIPAKPLGGQSLNLSGCSSLGSMLQLSCKRPFSLIVDIVLSRRS